MNKQRLLENIKKLSTENKSVKELYNEVSGIVMREVESSVKRSEDKAAYYLSMEFLMGRMFYNNLLCAGVIDEVNELLREKGVDINIFEEVEDTALGNGGLGRLAACFLDSGAELELPLYGYGIRYKYGLFKQAFKDGSQIELADDWENWGDPWSIRKDSQKRIIKFSDYSVYAVPYDMQSRYVINKKKRAKNIISNETNFGKKHFERNEHLLKSYRTKSKGS